MMFALVFACIAGVAAAAEDDGTEARALFADYAVPDAVTATGAATDKGAPDTVDVDAAVTAHDAGAADSRRLYARPECFER